jgi:hypothetical protein
LRRKELEHCGLFTIAERGDQRETASVESETLPLPEHNVAPILLLSNPERAGAARNHRSGGGVKPEKIPFT